nr:GEM-like protein 4 [Ipomoea batatas]
MKQNQMKSSLVPINYWAVLMNQSSRKWALPDSAATQCNSSPTSKQPKIRNGAMRLRPRITDTVKGKLILGAKLLQAGGIQKVFKKNFSTVRDGEKLLKASQCYLSTTSGPMPGLLFISTHKVSFLSERSIKIPSSTGKSSMRIHYKVSIPIAKIKRANEKTPAMVELLQSSRVLQLGANRYPSAESRGGSSSRRSRSKVSLRPPSPLRSNRHLIAITNTMNRICSTVSTMFNIPLAPSPSPQQYFVQQNPYQAGVIPPNAIVGDPKGIPIQ